MIQIGTNDLPSKKESTEYSNEIVNLALKLKSGTSRISIPNGQYHRQTEVNQHLQVMYQEKDISITDHGNAVIVRNLIGSKLNLHLRGNKVLTDTFMMAVSDILH